ncbi:hypothetical protein, partial [Xanthomonas arboricola]|uniref:hypothetical protein n=1 Tax=Xanthomonas arboricola TaxID=56448 RepID=UPI001955BF87
IATEAASAWRICDAAVTPALRQSRCARKRHLFRHPAAAAAKTLKTSASLRSQHIRKKRRPTP